MTKLSTRRVAAIAIVAAGLAALGLATSTLANTKPDTSRLSVQSISVTAKPITRFDKNGSDKQTFGKLRFLGGLTLTAPGAANFGGWSGILLDQDAENFTAISDSGVWMTGRLVYAAGSPAGMDQVRIGPLLAENGKPLRRGRDRDAEAIALQSGRPHDGSVLVAFERNSRLARYQVSNEGFSATLQILDRPKGARKMGSNKGFEAMTVMKGGPFKGTPIAIAERLVDKDGNHTGWIWQGHHPAPFHITNIDDFDVTDIASLDDGTLFVLERRFRWTDGVKMRVRRIAPEALHPGATLDGEILIEADLENEIDNMEGLDVTRRADGAVMLTMISDDNFNPLLQRSLLLQFLLPKSAIEKSEIQKTRPRG